ncbi:MAG: class II aldolase/adducin family protein, partial [Caulobacteraceae bacterium]|nr:class II aldolase/adducin family protein [Caulobacteraceae bacterium]
MPAQNAQLAPGPRAVDFQSFRAPSAGELAGVRSQVSPEEWRARVETAALYRLAAHFGWTEYIYNHISVAVPGEHAFLINPFGYMYEE